LKNNPRYAAVVSASRDPASSAHGLQNAGYATDPLYAKKLMNVMKQV
jgi:peptidoglycan hydrolase FlgJ